MNFPGFNAEASLDRQTTHFARSRTGPSVGITPATVPDYPCRGLSGCELVRCECEVTGGLMNPPSRYFPCGFCVHI